MARRKPIDEPTDYLAGIGRPLIKKLIAAPRREAKKARWEPEELKLLERFYANVPTKMIAKKLGRNYKSVHNKANLLGLKKSPAFRRASGRLAQRLRWYPDQEHKLGDE